MRRLCVGAYAIQRAVGPSNWLFLCSKRVNGICKENIKYVLKKSKSDVFTYYGMCTICDEKKRKTEWKKNRWCEAHLLKRCLFFLLNTVFVIWLVCLFHFPSLFEMKFERKINVNVSICLVSIVVLTGAKTVSNQSFTPTWMEAAQKFVTPHVFKCVRACFSPSIFVFKNIEWHNFDCNDKQISNEIRTIQLSYWFCHFDSIQF